MLDEPSEGLSPVANERVIGTCKALLAEGLSILRVEQNIHVAAALADRVCIIVSGRTVDETAMPALLGDEDLRQRYLGV